MYIGKRDYTKRCSPVRRRGPGRTEVEQLRTWPRFTPWGQAAERTSMDDCARVRPFLLIGPQSPEEWPCGPAYVQPDTSRRRRATSARTTNSTWSSRNHLRPFASVDGTRPRAARACTASTEHPSIAAAAGVGNQTCTSSGGRTPAVFVKRRRSRSAAAAARTMPSSITWLRDNDGRRSRGFRSPRATILQPRSGAHRVAVQPQAETPNRTCPAG